jgi:hypothetical protein
VATATHGFRDERSYRAGYDSGYSLAPSLLVPRNQVCKQARQVLRLSSDRDTYDEGDYIDGCADGVKDARK